MKNIYRQIMHHKKELTKLECIAADYFMESNKPVQLRELAQILHLSPATISRFVRKIEFDDYEQFYESYCSVLNDKEESNIDTYSHHIELVKKNHELIAESNIDEIVAKFIGKRVLVVAKEDTSFPCMDFVNRLKRIYIDAHLATSKQEMVLEENFLRDGDIVLVVSISGFNEPVNYFLNNIVESGYETIGMSTQKTNMMMMCNNYIELYLDTESIMSFNHSYSIPLTIAFDIIYSKIHERLDQKSLSEKEKTTNKIIA